MSQPEFGDVMVSGSDRIGQIMAGMAVIRTGLMAIAVLVGVAVAFEVNSPDKGPEIWADPDTGCQYVMRGTGIAPRSTKYGMHFGCRWEDPDDLLLPDLPKVKPAEEKEEELASVDGRIVIADGEDDLMPQRCSRQNVR